MKELLRRLASRPRLTTEIFVASLVINVLGLTSSIYSIVVLRRYLSVGLDSTLITLTVGALIAVFFEFLLRKIRVTLGREVSNRADRELSEAAFAAMSQSSYAHMTKIPAEQHRETLNGLSVVQQAYSPLNVMVLFDAPFAVLYLTVLYFISPPLAAIAGGISLLSLAFACYIQHKLREPAETLSKENAQLGTYNNALISAPDALRQFNWLGILRAKWSAKQQSVESIRANLLHLQNMSQQVGMSSAMLLSIVMMGVGAKLVMSGQLSVATLIGANILAARALNSINRCAQSLDQFARAEQQLKMLRVLALLPLERESGTRLPSVTGKLELRDVGFMYPGATMPVFESANLAIEPGQILVVKGGNGAGKTTMSKIVSGLVAPQRGEVRLDGVNLRQCDPYWMRRQFSLLPQEPVFFEGSLRENLVCSDDSITDDQIWQNCQQVGVLRFLETNPDGLDMAITGGGRQLPLGIRRRLALVRALLVQGAVVVLDEPTEGLDAEGCSAIAGMLNELTSSGRTLIIMSNDPFILSGASMVLDLDKKPVPQLLKPETKPVSVAQTRSNKKADA